RWNSVRDVRFLAALLKKNIRVRYTETPFTAGNKEFPAGTLVITRAGNEALGAFFDKQVATLANRFKVGLETVSTGFVDKGMDFGSDKVRGIKPPKVVLVAGRGVSSLPAGEIWHFFEQQIGYPLTII